MYLKKYHKAKFFAALLSMQDKEEKIDLYCKTAKEYGINIKAPDINKSEYDFTEVDGEIYYGLKSIKGVGDSSIPEIIANKPYASIEDAKERLSSKAFNKRIGMGLIKAGAFDFQNSNRNALINHFYDLRKDKEDRLDESVYNEEMCMEYERETLGTSITYTPWWDTVLEGMSFIQKFEVSAIREKTDRNGRLMAFADLTHGGQTIRACIFSSVYGKAKNMFISSDADTPVVVNIEGKKDKGQIIVQKVLL